MEQETLDLLVQHGFDVDGAMKRFLNNEALYIKCLKKFLTDENFAKLVGAKVAGDCEEAFKAAHTMKGFLSNLGIDKFYTALNPVVEKLRANNLDIDAELGELEVLYKETYDVISRL